MERARQEMELNFLVIDELGFSTDAALTIIQSETGYPVSIDGKYLTLNNGVRDHNFRRFDPINNNKQMKSLFNFFASKYNEECEDEGSGDGIVAYYPGEYDTVSKKGCIVCTMQNNTTIKSGNYVNESLRYLDIIMFLNRGVQIDLSASDKTPEEYYKKYNRR